MESQCLDLHFLYDQGCWTLFHVFIGPLCYSLEDCLFNSFSHLLIGLFVLFMFNLFSSLYILDIKSPVGWITGKDFFPFYRLSLCSASFDVKKLFEIDVKFLK
jgi:hypothetical protein